ncbi:sugar O-acyltransferase, sialic acid O-acetyltransferase NeuD family [Mariprofundus ferrinatatus]|uniref:Sugar O-acyltransferase, sialic acid O-acetyltransferase NeuD family n=1 Tax=Mariprofundus ferrinatatus TaxID=1921087 RepID=A0A2K8L2V4_9PROT|nr:acetyltransferase [Mariprofundus ferrinatatus]ATX81432.1 sugar O-acyltransferase, sialic acid O-acetyltransferase NeuD family [Mariprofundus ferrinatatus]
MRQLLILGAGGHGKVVAEIAEATGGWQAIAFLDDRHEVLNGTLRWPVVDGVRHARRLVDSYSHAIVAVGDSTMRLGWLSMLAAQGFEIPCLIHPTAWVSPSATVGAGTVVMANATIQADARIGQGCIINTAASIDHDCTIGDGVHVCPGAHLGGDVRVGNSSWLGIGCSVIHGIEIGGRVTVGAGAAVINPVADGLTVVGVPARGISGGLE